jgi:hypothetical protein
MATAFTLLRRRKRRPDRDHQQLQFCWLSMPPHSMPWTDRAGKAPRKVPPTRDIHGRAYPLRAR